MVSTRKKRQSSRRLLSQLDDFNQDFNIGNIMSERQEIAPVDEGTVDQDVTVVSSDSNPAVNKDLVNVKHWKCVLMKRLTGKWVILLTLSKTRFRTQF